MRRIKKYSNRKLYDTTDKTYISLNRVSELVQNGEKIVIVDSKTGEDLTSAIISQVLAREKGVPSNVLMQLLYKGQGTFAGTLSYARKYASVWQGALTMAEGEIDRLISKMVKDNEISEDEGGKFKKEMLGYAGNLKNWISEKVDQRVNEVFERVKPVSREQISTLLSRLESLENRLEQVEKRLEASQAGKVKKLKPAEEKAKKAG